ncbi:hypothetical protein CTEN210_18378 [Chaetoceros tenuissimus]|uniref:C-type lectin domain-containing protein n=1 Tax=Chaetoceros tenuissimus TaxID=426638 RepID=A0AAD3DCJ3_9STRA|nr:hypothetical protein CTEN210_18378 [Chaetoceros tenuissimus]
MTRQKYPACVEEVPSFEKFWTLLQNDECDMLFNNIQCGYDGGDCEDFNAIYPDCAVEYASRIADGRCDGYPYNAIECRLDGGDCRPDAIYCDSSKIGTIGDGICDEDLNTHECLYDKGDCLETKDLCDIKNDNGMRVIVPGDGICGVAHEVMELSSHQENMFNYTQSGLYAGKDECDYDGGDCLHPRYPGCYFDDRFPLFLSEIGDGICQNYFPYNTRECAWDGGDCLAFNAKYPECKGPHPEKIGDGICDKDYDTVECGYDEGDCGVPKYPECRVSDPSELGNGRCNFYGNYNTIKCGYDDGDCTEYNEAPETSRIIFYCLNLAEYSYQDHELVARDYNGHLFSLHYDYEQRFLENILFIFQKNSNPELWISGKYDEQENGTWLHEDGSLFDYSNWGPNEPSGYKDHNCISLTKTNWTEVKVTWRDALCTEEKGAVYKVTDLRAPGSDSTSIHCVKDSDIFGLGGT